MHLRSGPTEKRVDVAATVEDAQDIDTRLAQGIGDHHAALEGHKPQSGPEVVPGVSSVGEQREQLTATLNPPDEAIAGSGLSAAIYS